MDEVELNPPPAAKAKGHDVRAQDLRSIALVQAVLSSMNGSQTRAILDRATEFEAYLIKGAMTTEEIRAQVDNRQWAMSGE